MFKVMVLWGSLLLSAWRLPAQEPVLPGQWKWGAVNGVVEIYGNGIGRDPAGNTLQWTLRDRIARVYVLRWSHGYTDTVTLAVNGESLTAVNNRGMRFTATRIGPTGSGGVSGATIAGEWDWSIIGGVVVIDANGGGRDPAGRTVRWTLRDAGTRTYELRWSHGYVDNATLSADGNRMELVNSSGTRFTATRRQQAPPPMAPVDLNGSWGNGLVHIWQDGADVLMTATWKRNGKWVVIRGEGRLTGRVADLTVRYSPMPEGPSPPWRGMLTVSPDGSRIDAVYTLGATRDERQYGRDR